MEIVDVTLNPNDMGSGNTLSNGDLTVTHTTNSGSCIRATHGKTTGKWYWEVKYDGNSNTLYLGISNKTFSIASTLLSDTNWRSYYGSNSGNKFPENITYATSWSSGNIIGIALDLDIGTLEFYKNGISMGISHTNVKELGEVYPTLSFSTATNTRNLTFNFGATPFVYSIPKKFYSYDGRQYGSVNKILISSEDEYYSVNHSLETATPQMTSNTTPSGRAFASNIYQNNSSNAEWKAFDRIDGSGYVATGSIGYLGFEFEKLVIVNKYVVRAANLSRNTAPRNWTFEGSKDGINWVVLDTQVNQAQLSLAYTDIGEYSIDINEINSYKIYRLNWTANNGYIDYTSIGELRLYTPPKLLNLPNSSDQNFINHGMNKDTSIDITTSKILERRHIVQNNSQLGSGKIFKQKIDTTKIPIRNAMIE